MGQQVAYRKGFVDGCVRSGGDSRLQTAIAFIEGCPDSGPVVFQYFAACCPAAQSGVMDAPLMPFIRSREEAAHDDERLALPESSIAHYQNHAPKAPNKWPLYPTEAGKVQSDVRPNFQPGGTRSDNICDNANVTWASIAQHCADRKRGFAISGRDPRRD